MKEIASSQSTSIFAFITSLVNRFYPSQQKTTYVVEEASLISPPPRKDTFEEKVEILQGPSRKAEYYSPHDTDIFKKILVSKEKVLRKEIGAHAPIVITYQGITKKRADEIIKEKYNLHRFIAHAITRCENYTFGSDSETKKRMKQRFLKLIPWAISKTEIKIFLEKQSEKNPRICPSDIEKDLIMMSLGKSTWQKPTA